MRLPARTVRQSGAGLNLAPKHPIETFSAPADAPFDPAPAPPLDRIDRQRIEEFVGKNDADNGLVRPGATHFDNGPADAGQAAPSNLGRFAAARAQLDYAKFRRRAQFLPPTVDLLGDKPAEDRLELRVRIEVAFAAEDSGPAAVVTETGVIQSQLHEAAERQRPVPLDFFADDVGKRQNGSAVRRASGLANGAFHRARQDCRCSAGINEHLYEVVVESFEDHALQRPDELRVLQVARMNLKIVSMDVCRFVLQIDHELDPAAVGLPRAEAQQRVDVFFQFLLDFRQRLGVFAH